MTLHLLAYEKRGAALVSDVVLPGLDVGEAREVLHVPDHDAFHDAYPVTVEAAEWLAQRAELDLSLDDLDYFVEAHGD